MPSQDDFTTSGQLPQSQSHNGDRPKPPVELKVIGQPPLTMTRPLSLIRGRGYAATWPWTQRLIHEQEGEDGTVERFDPPRQRTGPYLHIVRDDGRVFTEEGENQLATLGMAVRLPEIPPVSRTWSWESVERYARGERPDPRLVFYRVRNVVNRFVDFDGSLADQSAMSELVACYILATYFTESFQVIGYLWATGASGSGKTQLLSVVAELACLGILVTAGGSFATLRDLADYGGCLCFDDAEKILHPRGDPDKQALILAGSRRGAVVTVKEPEGHRGWRTRHLNAYCPRAFSAIELPQSTLARRSIIVPLRRSMDPKRVSADPSDHDQWGTDRRLLVDALWAVGLAFISQMPAYARQAVERSGLAGVALDPWAGVLAVALWLEERGTVGLFARMRALAHSYQRQRQDLEHDNLPLVVEAIRDVGVRHADGFVRVKTQDVASRVQELAAASEILVDPNDISLRKIGKALSQLRLSSVPRPGGKGSRRWQIAESDLGNLEVAYGAVPTEPRDPWREEAEDDDEDVPVGH